MRHLVYNVRYCVVPVNSSLLTVTSHSLVITSLFITNQIIQSLSWRYNRVRLYFKMWSSGGVLGAQVWTFWFCKPWNVCFYILACKLYWLKKLEKRRLDRALARVNCVSDSHLVFLGKHWEKPLARVVVWWEGTVSINIKEYYMKT